MRKRHVIVLVNFLRDHAAGYFPPDFTPEGMKEEVEKYLLGRGRLISLFWLQFVLISITIVLCFSLLPLPLWVSISIGLIFGGFEIFLVRQTFAVDPELWDKVHNFEWDIHWAVCAMFDGRQEAVRKHWAKMPSDMLMAKAYESMQEVVDLYRRCNSPLGWMAENAHAGLYRLGMIRYDLQHFKDQPLAA